METLMHSSTGTCRKESSTQIASFIGSGINGNCGENDIRVWYQSKSLLLSEVELMETLTWVQAPGLLTSTA